MRAVLALLALACAPASARAQDLYQAWIHANAKECCPHDRCFPVIAVHDGRRWSVMGFKSDVPLGGERRWPFQVTYGCAYAGSADTIRCLFVPVPEAS